MWYVEFFESFKSGINLFLNLLSIYFAKFARDVGEVKALYLNQILKALCNFDSRSKLGIRFKV